MAEKVGNIGLINNMPKGAMGNPINLDLTPTPVFTDQESMMTLVTKLNGQQNLSSYNSLRGLVVEVAPQSQGGVLEQIFSLFDNGADKKVSQLAYVYIDVVHGSIQSFITPKTIKDWLTEVPIYGDEVAPGMLIEVVLDVGDRSVGKYVKTVTNDVPRGPLNGNSIVDLLCNSPSVAPQTPSPSSTPNNFGKENVGYLQALYVLAKWQADNQLQGAISEITFPFVGGGFVGSAIDGMIEMAKKTNAKILKNKSQDANPDKQWIKYMTQLLDSAVKYKDVPPDGRMIVRLSAPNRAYIQKIDAFSAYYTEPYGNDPTAFYMSFPNNRAKTPSTAELLEMTTKNLGTFLENFEKTYVGEVAPVATSPSPVTLHGLAVCQEGKLYANAPSDIEGVSFVDAGFQSKRKRRKKITLIVVHHSVTATAAGTNRVLSKRGLSVHFGVDRGNRAGVVEQHLPINIIGAHAGRLNNYSVSVENTNPTGNWGLGYKPDGSKGYEALYQLLLKLTKKLGIPFHIHEAHVVPDSFAFGKLEKNQHRQPGIMAHGSDLGTSHNDGAFELLYSQLRHPTGGNQTESTAYKNAVAMLAEAKKKKKFKKLQGTTKYPPTSENQKLNRVGKLRIANYPYTTLKLKS